MAEKKKGIIATKCREPGCPGLAIGENRYCDEHLHLTRNRYGPRYLRKLPFYDTEQWRRLRIVILHRNPICQRCQIKAAEVVHHIKPAREYPELRFATENLEALCHKCHNKETTKEVAARKQP